jgi:exopolysaccharide biosynthesis polyprenyl glycosylphosphotransferase
MAASNSLAQNICPDLAAATPAESGAPSRKAFRSMVTFAEMGADFFACAGVFASLLCFPLIEDGHRIQCPVCLGMSVSIVAGLLVMFLLRAEGAYCSGGSPLQIRETERILRISSQLFALPLCFSLLSGMQPFCRLLGLAALLVPLVLLIEKQILLAAMRVLSRRGYGVERVLVWGVGDAGRRIASSLLYSPRLGLSPVAVIEQGCAGGEDRLLGFGYKPSRPIPMFSEPITAELLNWWKCDTLVVALDNLPVETMEAAILAAQQAKVRVARIPDSALPADEWIEPVGPSALRPISIDVLAKRSLVPISKRAVDLVISALLLLAFAPLLLLIALLIRLDSRGPALFIQKRVGFNGKLFSIYKFRSMYRGVAEYDVSPASAKDKRITRVGKLLRRTSLDELPQLVNVLLGNMSLVGPRPEMPFIVDRYSVRERQRLTAIPGITGLWQLSAHRASPIHENIQYDLYYIRNRTFFMDAAILVHTLFFAMRGV